MMWRCDNKKIELAFTTSFHHINTTMYHHITTSISFLLKKIFHHFTAFSFQHT